jgi:hypothetical protein
MYWIGWVVEKGDPIASAIRIREVVLPITDCVSNDSNTIIDNLLARLGQLAVSTCLRRQVDNDRSS